MSWPGVFDPPPSCSFCGHRPHDGACPGRIAVRRGRPPADQTIVCPCTHVAQNRNNDRQVLR